jgi:LemA protein
VAANPDATHPHRLFPHTNRQTTYSFLKTPTAYCANHCTFTAISKQNQNRQTMQISRNLITIGVLALLALILFSTCTGTYNSAVTKQEGVTKAWSQVENVYQRRADLIPNLVNTVKGYAAHEASTFQAITEARSNASSMKIDASNLTPEKIKEFEAVQGQLSQGIGRLLAVAENYPVLKADASFMKLQDELAGTENRITKERKDFNDTVGDYNTYIRKFPANLIVGMFGFQTKGYFQSVAGSEKAPEVKF